MGSLLLEAIVAIGVFSIFLGGVGLTIVLGERSTIAGGDRVRGAFVAERALEGLRQMARGSFNAVAVPGLHGVAESAGSWQFSGTSVTTTDGYRSAVNILSRTSDWIEAVSTVNWNFGQTRSGTVVLDTYLTNWHKTGSPIDCSRLPVPTVLTQPSGTPRYEQIAVNGNYAFVTSSDGTKGLHIFDISNPAAPFEVALGFTLNASAYGVAVNPQKSQLYLATDNPSAEFQVYNINSPSTLNSGDLRSSFDVISGIDAKARVIATESADIASLPPSIALGHTQHSALANALDVPAAHAAGTCGGTVVFIGTLGHNTAGDQYPELYSVGVDDAGQVSACGSLEMGADIRHVSLTNGYAYAATNNVAGEAEVADVYDPTNMLLLPGEDFQNPAQAVATFGTGAFVGVSQGEPGGELVFSSIVDPTPARPPLGSAAIGGDVTGITVSTDENCAFVAATSPNSQIRAFTVPRFNAGAAASYTVIASTPPVQLPLNSVVYDWQSRKLYAIARNTLYIFSPGS